MLHNLAVDLPFGYPAVPVLSAGVAAVVDAPSPNWDDRLWDIVFVSNAAGAEQLSPALRRFTVRMNPGLPEGRVEHFVRHDVDGVPHLYLLAEWNRGHHPTVVIPQVPMADHGGVAQVALR